MPRFWYELSSSHDEWGTETVLKQGLIIARDQRHADRKVGQLLRGTVLEDLRESGYLRTAQWGFGCLPFPRGKD